MSQLRPSNLGGPPRQVDLFLNFFLSIICLFVHHHDNPAPSLLGCIEVRREGDTSSYIP
jgi:hypothetical protein